MEEILPKKFNKGFSEMVKLSALYKSLNSSPSHVELKGTLVSGMGEGAYYMGLKDTQNNSNQKLVMFHSQELLMLD